MDLESQLVVGELRLQRIVDTGARHWRRSEVASTGFHGSRLAHICRQHSSNLLFDELAAGDDVGQRLDLGRRDRTQLARAQKLRLAGDDRQISLQVVHGHC